MKSLLIASLLIATPSFADRYDDEVRAKKLIEQWEQEEQSKRDAAERRYAENELKTTSGNGSGSSDPLSPRSRSRDQRHPEKANSYQTD